MTKRLETADYAARYLNTRDRFRAAVQKIQPAHCEIFNVLKAGKISEEWAPWDVTDLLEETTTLEVAGEKKLRRIKKLRDQRHCKLVRARRSRRHRRGWDHVKYESDAAELQGQVEELLTEINDLTQGILEDLARAKELAGAEARANMTRRKARADALRADRRAAQEKLAAEVAAIQEAKRAKRERIKRLTEHPFIEQLRGLKLDG